MNLQEQISRMKSMMGLNEVTNPYKVNWEYPTQEYFTQELSELLGNPGRFTDQEFFNPDNYDTVYRIMPNTFKTIAEFVKGEEIENESEIKDILLNQNLTRTIVSGEGEFNLSSLTYSGSPDVYASIVPTGTTIGGGGGGS